MRKFGIGQVRKMAKLLQSICASTDQGLTLNFIFLNLSHQSGLTLESLSVFLKNFCHLARGNMTFIGTLMWKQDENRSNDNTISSVIFLWEKYILMIMNSNDKIIYCNYLLFEKFNPKLKPGFY